MDHIQIVVMGAVVAVFLVEGEIAGAGFFCEAENPAPEDGFLLFFVHGVENEFYPFSGTGRQALPDPPFCVAGRVFFQGDVEFPNGAGSGSSGEGKDFGKIFPRKQDADGPALGRDCRICDSHVYRQGFYSVPEKADGLISRTAAEMEVRSFSLAVFRRGEKDVDDAVRFIGGVCSQILQNDFNPPEEAVVFDAERGG